MSEETIKLESKRKYYVITSLNEGQIKEKFSQLNTQFERTCEKDKAEFIIFDLSFPEKHFEYILRTHLECKKEQIFFFREHVPIVFVDFEGKKDADLIKNMEEEYNCSFFIYNDGYKLLRALSWFEKMLPYYCYRRFSKEDIDAVISLLIGNIKARSISPGP